MIDHANGVQFEYTTQKNCNAGEKIAHSMTGNLLLCPTKAIARLVKNLRLHNAPRTTPLHSTDPATKLSVHARHITAALRHAAHTAAATTGIDPDKITARSLRPGGATALLCAKVDPNTIQLVGRWKLDSMLLRYLHAQAVPAMANRAMFQHGTFTFQPHQLAPDQANIILQEATALLV